MRYLLVIQITLLPETGLVPQAGDIKTQEQARDVKFEPIFSQIGSGSLFSFGGAVETVAQTDDTFGLFNVSGSTAFSRTRPYIGSGSLFTLNGAAEAVTWDYNETSIDVVTTEDYGNVVDSVTTTDDYGSVTETTTAGEFTYGTIVNTSTTFPLTGSYVVSGNSVEKSIVPETGGVHSVHSLVSFLVEKVTFAEEATGLFDIVGVDKLQEREIMLVLDLYLDSVDVQKQLLGITTKPLLMYSAQKTMVLSVLLQQFWKTMVLSAILLLQEKRTMVQSSILLPHILLQAQLILLVLLRLQNKCLYWFWFSIHSIRCSRNICS